MKKTVYILIFTALLMGLIAALVLSGITSDKSPKSSLSDQKAAQIAKSPENPIGNPVKEGVGQSSASGSPAQEQTQINISREKEGSSVPSSSGQNSPDKDKGDLNTDFQKDSPNKNDTQKNAGAGIDKAVNENDAGSQDDSAAEQQKGTEVNLAIVGSEGKIIFGPARVIIKDDNKWGATALGALDASGIEYAVSPGFAGFVTSIAGETNKGMKGWMYEVNDEVPMKAAGDMKLAAGDRVLWWYSESLDKPAPAWNELEKTQ